MFDSDYQALWEAEKSLRVLYALDPKDPRRPDTKNPLFNLIRIEPHKLPRGPRLQRTLKYPLPHNTYRGNIPLLVLPPKLRNRVFIAGGYVTALIKGTFFDDIDLFMVGPDPRQTLKDICAWLDGCATWKVTRTKNAISFERYGRYEKYPEVQKIQVILRAYNSPSEVITGFDVDSCCCLLHGEAIYTTPRGYRALTTETNVVNLELASTTYENRLVKYYYRNFKIQLPIGTPSGAFKLHREGYAYLKKYKKRYPMLGKLEPARNIASLIYRCLKNDYGAVRTLSDYSGRIKQGNYIVNSIYYATIEYFVQNIDEPVNHSDFEHGRNYETAPVDFMVVNPGQQNFSWSFQPLELSWMEWMRTEVKQKDFTRYKSAGVVNWVLTGGILRDFQVPYRYYSIRPNYNPAKEYFLLEGKNRFWVTNAGKLKLWSEGLMRHINLDLNDRFDSSEFIDWNYRRGKYFSPYPCPFLDCICECQKCHVQCTPENCVTCDPKHLRDFPKPMYINKPWDK